jgi:hypothetical protein
MTSGDLLLRRSVHRSRLRSSRVLLALRWMMLEMVLGVGVMRRWLYLAAMDLGIGPARCCLVLSLQWAMTPFQGM